MKIRKAKPSDIDGIYEIFLDMLKAEDAASRKVAEHLMKVRKRRKNFKTYAKKELSREIKEKGSSYLIAEEDGVIIGYAYGTIKKNKDPFFELPPLGFFNALCVKRSSRGRGVASKLNAELEKWFRKHKCSHIYLEVFSENPAVDLYKNWRYKITSYKMVKNIESKRK